MDPFRARIHFVLQDEVLTLKVEGFPGLHELQRLCYVGLAACVVLAPACMYQWKSCPGPLHALAEQLEGHKNI